MQTRPLRRPPLRLQALIFAAAIASGSISVAQAQSWTPLNTTGSAPNPRRQAGVIVDEAGGRLIVAGGEFSDTKTWALDLSAPTAWTVLNQNVPAPAADVVRAVYDPVRRRMILVTWDLAVYALDLVNSANWQMLIAAGTGPIGRRYPVIALDSFRNRLLVFGGGPDTGIWSDVWALDLGPTPSWTQINPSGPAPAARWGAVGVYDPIGDRLIIGTGQAGGTLADFWQLSLSAPAWAPLATAGPVPPNRYLSAAAYDPVNRQVLMFAGVNGNTALNDLWSLALGNTPTWTLFPGPSPPPRWSHALAFSASQAILYTHTGWDGTQFRSDPWFMALPNPGAPPKIQGFTPTGGQIGDPVAILGTNLADPTEVKFGDLVATVSSSNFTTIHTVVPAGAVTAPITVTTSAGTAVSSESFYVGELADLTDVQPDSGRWGEVVTLRGHRLSSTQRVAFGGVGNSPFVVLTDSVLSVTVDTLAASGHIRVTTLVGVTESDFDFHVLPDDARPRLLSVRDVAGDQGGRVLLRWRASDFDRSRYKSITGYRVWRRAPLEALSMTGSAASTWHSSRELGIDAGAPPAFWENIAQLPASFLPGYAYAAATLQDSTELGNPWTAYFVQAITADPFAFYNSSPDSGYSVDNLAPPAPTQVAVQYAPTANILHWRGRNLADLRGYRIHRGADAFFVPSASNLVVTTADTSYVDIAGSHFYKLAAVDLHGNVSRYVAISPDRPVATLVSFFRARREHGLARIEWFSGGNPNLVANVYRRTAETDWESVGQLLSDGLGYLTLEDRSLEDDAAYGYRLGIVEPGESESFMAEAWIDPLAVAFTFAGRVMNPSTGGSISCSFAVPFGARGDVRLYDVSGRELERQILEAGASGERSVRFGSTRRLRAGVYLIRASSGSTVVSKRVVVLD